MAPLLLLSYTGPVIRQQLCPKKVGSDAHARYERYKSSRTLAAASAAGMGKMDRMHDVRQGYVKACGPCSRKPAVALRAGRERPAEVQGLGSSSASGPPVPIHSVPCTRSTASASHASPERQAPECPGLGCFSAAGPPVHILIISIDEQRASRCKLALAQAGHVEAVQVRG